MGSFAPVPARVSTSLYRNWIYAGSSPAWGAIFTLVRINEPTWVRGVIGNTADF